MSQSNGDSNDTLGGSSSGIAGLGVGTVGSLSGGAASGSSGISSSGPASAASGGASSVAGSFAGIASAISGMLAGSSASSSSASSSYFSSSSGSGRGPAMAGGEKLDKALHELSAKMKAGTVRVGFLEGATYPDGTSVAMVAAIQEYGAPSRGIPPRPFFRKLISEKSAEWGKALAPLLAQNQGDVPRTLGMIGEGIKAQLQESIRSVQSPPLSPVTLLLRERFGNSPGRITFADVQEARGDIAKGVAPKVSGTGAKPLVWTGHLLNSVDYAVKMKDS